MSINPEEKIEQYLSGQLSGDVLRKFEKQLQTDPLLAKQVEQHRRMDQYLEHKAKVPELQQKLKNLSGKYFEEEPPTDAPNRRPWIIASIIVVALAILAILFFFREQTPPSYQQYAQHFPLSVTSQSGTTTETLTSLEEAFNQQQYSASIPLFESYIQENPDDPQVQLYYGIALLETNQIQKSRSVFQKIIQEGSLWKEDAQWYLALLYLKINQPEQLKTQLQDLSPNNRNYSHAKKLLNQLE
jgi:tetratricopeptide (TPR) repeat protein